jgi:DNA-binding NtrC family response regulator
MDQFNRMRDRRLQGFSPCVLYMLMNYCWPGNVRELENFGDRMVVLRGQGIVESEDLPAKMRTMWTPSQPAATEEILDEGFCVGMAVREFERELSAWALKKAEGVKDKATQLLGIKRTTLIEKLKRHSLLFPRLFQRH